MSERIGLFADLHSNLEAYEACMEKAQELGVSTKTHFLGQQSGKNTIWVGGGNGMFFCHTSNKMRFETKW